LAHEADTTSPFATERQFMTDTVTPDHVLQIGMGVWASKTLLSAVELGVFTELAREPADLAALSRRFGLHDDNSARDLLDALVALGLLERQAGIYRNTAGTNQFLDRAKPSYLGGILEMANARLYPACGPLTQALHVGEPQNEAAGSDDTLGAIFYADPDRLRFRPT
jgi:hypothetical protein